MEGLVTEFSDGLWYSLIDYATVQGKKDVRFMFKNGMKIQA
jgi:hypothetical protein